MEKFQVPVNNAFAIERREHDKKTRKRTISCWLKVLFTEERLTPFQNKTECSFPTENLTNFGTAQRNCWG